MKAAIDLKGNKFISVLESQERLWFEWCLSPNSLAYNIRMLYILKGDLNAEVLIKCIENFTNRNPILNACFEEKNGKPFIKFLDLTYAPIVSFYDLSNSKKDKQEKEASDITDKHFNTPYDLSIGPLFRYFLIKKNTHEFILGLCWHHILVDAISIRKLIKDISDEYNSLIKGQALDNCSLANTFSEYQDLLDDQSTYLKSEELQKQLNYWSKRLKDACFDIPLWQQKYKNTFPRFQGKRIYFELDKKWTEKINLVIRECKVTPFIFWSTVFGLLLHKYTAQNDLIFGYTVSTRSKNMQNLPCFLINSIPLRINIESSYNFLGILQHVKDMRSQDKGYQCVPTRLILKELRERNDSGITSLFNIMINQSLSFASNKFTIEDVECNIAKIGDIDPQCGLLLSFDLLADIFAFEIEFDKRIYDETFIRFFKENLLNTAKLVAENPNEPISNLEIINQEERNIISSWNKTSNTYPEKCLHHLIDEVSRKYSNRRALVFQGHTLTYKELREKVNILKGYLQSLGVKEGDLVAISLERSLEMIIAILAVISAGAAYVPIDPEYPKERVKCILGDCKAKVILSKSNVKLSYEDKNNHIKVDLDSFSFSNHKTKKIKTKEVNITNNQLLYVIYTSGSTGVPKGVMMEHKSVVNRLIWMQEKYHLQPEEKVLQKTSFSFDVSVWEIFWPLITGATLVIAPPGAHRDPVQLHDLIKKSGISTIHFVPTMLGQFLDCSSHKECLSLRRVFCSGEALSNELRLRFLKALPQVEFYNLYGPTEAAVDCTYWDCKEQNKYIDVSIGHPISNMGCYVLSEGLKLQPIGAIGELCVTGIGLARGYLNKPELTNEKFVDNPFSATEGQEKGLKKLYKTGDLVRYLPDGNIEYIGRIDHQVKIRGYRIELGEVESILSGYEEIRQSVVLAKEYIDIDEIAAGNKYLVGYYVSDSKLDEEAIFNYLSSRLPEYMVPNILVHLKKLPLTVNGKLDKKALPEPEFSSSKGDGYVVPRNELEVEVCSIWAGVLGLPVEHVGIKDDFFKLGGDSIISMQLVSRLRQRLGLHISVKDIFSYRNIERLSDTVLAKLLVNNSVKTKIKTEQGLLSGKANLLPIQKWFFESDFKKLNHWNQSFIIRTPELDIEKLRSSIGKLVAYHDIFSMCYKKDLNTYTQYYNASLDTLAITQQLKILDIRTLQYKEGSKHFHNKLNEILTEWQSEFDIESGRIYSIGYLYGYKDGSSRIHFALHHLIVDTVSWRIIAEDLRDLYEGKELGNKGSSYRQWVEVVRDYSNRHAEEMGYWNNVLADYDIDNNDASNQINGNLGNKVLEALVVSDDTTNQTTVILDREQTKQLLQNSSKAYNTQIDDILLTAFGYVLAGITGSKVNHVLLEGHGREEIDDTIDITRTVGWFTTMYPARLEVDKDLGSSIKMIKEMIRKISNKGIGYGSLIGYDIKSLPKISFNYLGQFDDEQKFLDQGTAPSIKRQQRYWNITGEDSGMSVNPSNQDHNIININGLIIDNKLKFSIESKLDEKTTLRIAKLFKEKLVELIRYTLNIGKVRSYLTSSDIGNIVSQNYLDRIQMPKEIEGVYLANSLQQGFIYHALNQGNVDDAYKVQLIWDYESYIQVDTLKKAWEYAQIRYPTLRLRFSWEEELVQIIDKEGKVDLRYIDLSEEVDFEEQERVIRQIQVDDRKKLYDLKQGSLFRVHLIKRKKELYRCIFSNYHPILDGWSNPILFEYVHKVYQSLINNEKPTISIDYCYANVQKYLQEHEVDNVKYWRKYIEQIEERVDLSGLLSNLRRQDELQIRLSEYRHIKEPKEKRLIIERILYQSLKKVTKEVAVTLNAILQYAWHKVLNIYGNSRQTVVGTTVSGRNLPVDDIETSVGLFINTLPLIVDHKKEDIRKTKTILEQIRDIQDHISEINGRSNISLAKLQKGGERLFDSLFVYENYPMPEEEQQSQLVIRFRESIEKSDYPLAVMAYELGNSNEKEDGNKEDSRYKKEQLILEIKYAAELFDQETIEGMLSSISIILQQIVSNPNEEVQNLSYLNVEQHNQIIYSWNETDKDYPSNKTIQQLFEEQVERIPGNIAVVYEGTKLTYRELNNRANQLAHYLIERYKIKADDLIVLCLDRSEHMLISILAVLKAGGAYVPIEPSYPDERIQYILKDSNTKLILTNEVHRRRLEEIRKINSANSDVETNQSLEIVSIDSKELQERLLLQLVSNPNGVTKSNNLAYIVYTSGTTGNPKGVMIEHRGVVNLAIMQGIEFGLTGSNEIKNCLWYSSYVFDAHVSELYTSILNGHVIYIIKNEAKQDLHLLESYIASRNINIATIPPALLSRQQIRNLQILVVAGDKSNLEVLNSYYNNGVNIINAYGPTEITVCSSLNHYRNNGVQNIGAPISNTKAYVLDDSLTPLPVGAIGELHIGGVGLARGYLNRPDLTSEKFIANPFQSEEERRHGKNTKLYKTGDLVRWLPDGNLEYIGRHDFQVKVRGYRIELGEVESALSSYEGVKQSVVITKEHKKVEGIFTGSKYLVGYYVSEAKLDEEDIISYLGSKLPEYMVPSILVHLKKLPLTVNGKLDRVELPEPEFTDKDSYMAPRNELESKICGIWTEVLGLSEGQIGIQDDFLRLGGNSILAIRLISKLNNELKSSLNVSTIFKYNTVAKLAEWFSTNDSLKINVSYKEAWGF